MAGLRRFFAMKALKLAIYLDWRSVFVATIGGAIKAGYQIHDPDKGRLVVLENNEQVTP